MARRPGEPTIHGISTRRLLYWLAAMVVLLVVGTIIGLIWADTSDVAGAFAVVTTIIGVAGIVLLLIRMRTGRSPSTIASLWLLAYARDEPGKGRPRRRSAFGFSRSSF